MDKDKLARGIQTRTEADSLRTVKAAESMMAARYALRYRAAALASMLDIPLSQCRWFESANYYVPARYMEKQAKVIGVSLDYLTGKASEDKFILEVAGGAAWMSLPTPEEFEEYDIGEAIRQLRVKADLSLEQAAKKVRVAAMLLTQWEARVRVPNRDSLMGISKGLGMEYNVLLSIPANLDEDVPVTKEESDILNA